MKSRQSCRVGIIESGPNNTFHSRLKWNLPSAGSRSVPLPFHALPMSDARCRVKYMNVTTAPNRCSVRAVSGPPMTAKIALAQSV